MREYFSFFKLRFVMGLQYRAAALAGVATQLAWGFMYIMVYYSFYKSNPVAIPMEIKELASYIWLQQSFLVLFMTWFLDNDIFETISNGNVSYELCRPLNMYNMWFAKNLAIRTSRVLLRCFPILIIASFFPGIYKFNGPASVTSFILFLISLVIGVFVVVSYCMLIYIFTFYTISPMGIKMVMVMVADFLAGGIIPLPMLPDWLNKYLYLLPFAAMQNTPFRIYSGNITINDGFKAILLQIFWAMILILIGRLAMSEALKKVVVQGG